MYLKNNYSSVGKRMMDMKADGKRKNGNLWKIGSSDIFILNVFWS